MLKTIPHWLAAALCFALTVWPLIHSGHLSKEGPDYAFLACCFALLGTSLAQTQAEVRDLRKRLAEVEGKPLRNAEGEPRGQI